MVKTVNFILYLFYRNKNHIKIWIISFSFSIAIYLLLLRPNFFSRPVYYGHLCMLAHVDKQNHTQVTLCPAETHPQTGIHPETTYMMTPTIKPMARLMQPVFLETLTTKQPDWVPAQPLNSSPWWWWWWWWGIYLVYVYSLWKENCVHIPGSPSGIANPRLLHQAHEQTDFSPYMAVGCTQQLHVTPNSGVLNVNAYNWELSLCTFTGQRI